MNEHVVSNPTTPLEAENKALRQRVAKLEQQLESAQQGPAMPLPDTSNPQQTLRLLEHTFAHLRDAVFTLNEESIVVAVNHAACEMFGYRQEEMIGHTTDFLHCNNKAITVFRARLFAAVAEKGYLFLPRFQMRRKDGNTFPSEHSVMPLYNDDGVITGWVSVVRDLTEIEQMERAYRTVVEHSLQGLVIFQDGGFVFANPAMGAILGYSVAELLAMSAEQIRSMIHPDDRERIWLYAWEQLGGKPVPTHYEFRALRRDGEVRWVEVYTATISYRGKRAIHGAYIDITERKRTEEALRESEATYRAMFEKNQAVKLLIEPDSGAIVDANPAACTFYGYAREALCTMHITDINVMPPEQVQAEMQGARSEQRLFFSFRHRLASGDMRDVEVYSGPIEVRGRPLLFSIVHDITERKRAEEALLASEERFERAVRAGRVGVWDWDLQTNAIYLAPNLKALLGYADHEIRNHLDDWGQYVYSEDQEEVMAAAEACLQGRTPTYEIEHRMVHKDGSLRWISVRGTVVYDETGTPVRMSGTDTDITERKQAEEERDRFFSLALDMLCVVGADGYFKRLNPAWERTLGFTTAELLAEPSINFVHPDDRETTRAAMRYAVSGDSLIAFENRYRCKDGSYRWLSWSVTMLPDQQVAYGVARDITARKQAEQERQRQIMQAAVHKERARLARELHDSVTQSLYSINLLSEGCRFHATHGTLEQGEQHFARLGSIAHEALKEMRLLIYQLRLPVLEQEGLIGALQHRLETVERRSQVEAHLQVEGITHLPVDLEENLYWIIQEALNNALKHAGAPAIWVRLAALPPDADGPAPGSYGAFTIQAEVCDNGCGFEPATTQMGMGFASMQERVDYLGGTLTIHAAPGAGTTIRVHCTPRSMM